MKFAVMGLAMLATGTFREREAPVTDIGGGFSGESPVMSTSVEDVGMAAGAAAASEGDEGAKGGREAVTAQEAPPGAGGGDWRVACELRTGAELIFDRGSLRELGSTTLVRWAAPGDPRVNEPVYTALVSCGEKTIEATWPGRRAPTRAGTCGRRLVEAVCDAATATAKAKPARTARHAVEAR